MRRSTSLLAVGLLLAFHAHGDEDNRTIRPPSFPGKLGLEGKWDAFRSRPAVADVAQTLLQEDAEGQQFVHWDNVCLTSLWAGVDRLVRSRADVADELRKLPEGEAKALVDTARRGDDLAKVIAVYRRHPYARSVHEALIDLGEKELRLGHAGRALRCFEDVLTRAADDQLRARAQVGVWLALAHESDDAALTAAFLNVPPDATFPLFGESLKATSIRTRLQTGSQQAPAPIVLADLRPWALTLPASPSWIDERPGVHADGALVAGPNLLAWFAADSDRPRWSHVSPTAVSSAIWAPVGPGPFAPAVARGRVFTRWGVEAVPDRPRDRGPRHQLTHLAAFDIQTGEMLWSTAREPAWETLAPVNDPVYSEGRLYVLAVSRKDEYASISLVCLDADSGAVQWKRELVAHHTALRPSALPRSRPAFTEIDVTHFGNAVAVVRGAVYCQTNLGVVARCDARDGLVEWVRSYPRNAGTAAFLTLARRQGTTPIVAGHRVVFLPRDALTVLALHSETGDLLWQKAEDASFRALGTVGERVLVADARTVTALELASGKTAWERRFDASIEAKTTLAGSTLYAATANKLFHVSALTGDIVEARDWQPPESMMGLAVNGPQLAIAVKGKTQSDSPRRDGK